MPYWRLFYHIVWSTKNREPMILPSYQQPIQGTVRAAGKEHHALVHAVGIMPDHVHVVAPIPPNVAISVVIGDMKGKSSRAINAMNQEETGIKFSWQAEYGLLSFGERAFKEVVDYTNNQAERHATQRLWSELERSSGPNPSTGASHSS